MFNSKYGNIIYIRNNDNYDSFLVDTNAKDAESLVLLIRKSFEEFKTKKKYRDDYVEAVSEIYDRIFDYADKEDMKLLKETKWPFYFCDIFEYIPNELKNKYHYQLLELDDSNTIKPGVKFE